MRRSQSLVILVSIVLSLFAGTATAQQPSDEPTIVYLVRHAEKVEATASANPSDPDLTPAGSARAEELVRLLGEAGVTGIFSTDYRRTLQTVKPLADHLGLEIESYDPRELGAFANTLRSQPGRLVVSGHSNTNPELVKLLGGDPGPPIVEATEYDRLYVLFIDGDQTTTVVLRYGERSMEGIRQQPKL